MSQYFVPGVGVILSADIAVSDHEREARFYSRVLGTGDQPLWRDDLTNNRGMPIIGLGPRTPALAHLPLQWMPHIQVADVAASVQRARDSGGSVLMHEVDTNQNSQWAVLTDLNGAAFGVIPVIGPEMLPAAATSDDNAPLGRIYWVDLTVPNADATRDFYRQVVGWSVQDVEMQDGDARYADYNMLGQHGNPAAGVCHAHGVNTGLPPVWMLYLPVGNVAESLRRVEAEGGSVIKTTRAKDGKYVYAAIQDPVGASLALVQG